MSHDQLSSEQVLLDLACTQPFPHACFPPTFLYYVRKGPPITKLVQSVTFNEFDGNEHRLGASTEDPDSLSGFVHKNRTNLVRTKRNLLLRTLAEVSCFVCRMIPTNLIPSTLSSPTSISRFVCVGEKHRSVIATVVFCCKNMDVIPHSGYFRRATAKRTSRTPSSCCCPCCSTLH